jgi:hypothetical protein
LFLRRYNKYAIPTIAATPNTAPTAIPAVAPDDNPPLSDLSAALVVVAVSLLEEYVVVADMLIVEAPLDVNAWPVTVPSDESILDVNL